MLCRCVPYAAYVPLSNDGDTDDTTTKSNSSSVGRVTLGIESNVFYSNNQEV